MERINTGDKQAHGETIPMQDLLRAKPHIMRAGHQGHGGGAGAPTGSQREMLRGGDGQWVLKDEEKLGWGNRMEGKGRNRGPGSEPHCAKACGQEHGQFGDGQVVCVATGWHMKGGREVDQGWEAQRPQWRALRAKVRSRALDECTRNCTRMQFSHLLTPTWVGIRGTFWDDLRSPAEAGQCEP